MISGSLHAVAVRVGARRETRAALPADRATGVGKAIRDLWATNPSHPAWS